MTAIYTDEILRHDRQPKNWGLLANASHRALGTNPICGDQIHVSVVVADHRVSEIGVDGSACALCRASASMMSVHLANRAVADVELIANGLHDLLAAAPVDRELLGNLVAFEAVHKSRPRWKCVTLPFHALSAALAAEPGAVGVEYNTWAMRRRRR